MGVKSIIAILHTSLIVTVMTGAIAGETMESKLERLEKALATQHQAVAEEHRRLSVLERTLAYQTEVIARQEQVLDLQRREIESLRKWVLLRNRRWAAPSLQPAIVDFNDGSSDQALQIRTNWLVPVQQTQWERSLSQARGEEKPVGEAPPKTERVPPEVKAVPELGGVLTPQGKLVLEPSLEYSHSQVNRFTFSGVEILDTFLIGILEAQEADRDLISPALTARYGITERLELEVKVPYVYRDETLSTNIPQVTGGVELTRNLDGHGIGDVEVGLHYQINRGLKGWPFFVANLRYKSNTGEGPFDVDRNAEGVETELPTGSGFHAIEPSLTVLFPSDPAVFFTNVGYLIHIQDDVDKTFGDQRVGKVDPGDAFRISFGMAYAINEATSFTIGYKHDFIEETDTEINDVNFSSSSLDVGAVLLGSSYQLSDRVGISLNLEIGATEDAPDVRLTLRVPVLFDLF